MNALACDIGLSAFKIMLLFDRHCPYVLDAIIALAELGATFKDIISLFPQVC